MFLCKIKTLKGIKRQKIALSSKQKMSLSVYSCKRKERKRRRRREREIRSSSAIWLLAFLLPSYLFPRGISVFLLRISRRFFNSDRIRQSRCQVFSSAAVVHNIAFAASSYSSNLDIYEIPVHLHFTSLFSCNFSLAFLFSSLFLPYFEHTLWKFLINI